MGGIRYRLTSACLRQVSLSDPAHALRRSVTVRSSKTGYARRGVPEFALSQAWNELMGEETEQNRIRLVLLDDHGLFRTSLARFLAAEPGFEIAGECGTS